MKKIFSITANTGKFLKYVTRVLLCALILNSFLLIMAEFIWPNSLFTSVVQFSQTISSDGEPVPPPTPEPPPSPSPSPLTPPVSSGGGSAGIAVLFPKKIISQEKGVVPVPSDVQQKEVVAPQHPSASQQIREEFPFPFPLILQQKTVSEKISPNLSSPLQLRGHPSNPLQKKIPTDDFKAIFQMFGDTFRDSIGNSFENLPMRMSTLYFLVFEIILIVALLVSTLLLSFFHPRERK